MNTENQNFEQLMNECKQSHKRKRIVFGIFAIVLGGLLLINVIHPNTINFHYVWPSFLILIGLKAIFKSKSRHHCC